MERERSVEEDKEWGRNEVERRERSGEEGQRKSNGEREKWG